MNLFRLCGDVSHVVSIVVLALRLNATKSAVGISLKTQELYLIVFVARYADLFSHFYSLYNTFMKIAFITSTAARLCTGLQPGPDHVPRIERHTCREFEEESFSSR